MFEPNKPVNVHPDCVEAAQAVGAAFVDESEAQTKEGNVPEPPRVTPSSERHDKLVTLFSEMRKDSAAHRDHFTAGGRPNRRWVQQELELEFSLNEINEAWAEVSRGETSDAA
jgi:hypothetical protein